MKTHLKRKEVIKACQIIIETIDAKRKTAYDKLVLKRETLIQKLLKKKRSFFWTYTRKEAEEIVDDPWSYVSCRSKAPWFGNWSLGYGDVIDYYEKCSSINKFQYESLSRILELCLVSNEEYVEISDKDFTDLESAYKIKS